MYVCTYGQHATHDSFKWAKIQIKSSGSTVSNRVHSIIYISLFNNINIMIERYAPRSVFALHCANSIQENVPDCLSSSGYPLRFKKKWYKGHIWRIHSYFRLKLILEAMAWHQIRMNLLWNCHNFWNHGWIWKIVVKIIRKNWIFTRK